MGWAFMSDREKRNAYRILDRKTEARNHLEILHVDGGIT